MMIPMAIATCADVGLLVRWNEAQMGFLEPTKMVLRELAELTTHHKYYCTGEGCAGAKDIPAGGTHSIGDKESGAPRKVKAKLNISSSTKSFSPSKPPKPSSIEMSSKKSSTSREEASKRPISHFVVYHRLQRAIARLEQKLRLYDNPNGEGKSSAVCHQLYLAE